MSDEVTPFERRFTPLIEYATHFDKYEESVQHFKALPDEVGSLIAYLAAELAKSSVSAQEIRTQINKLSTEIAMVLRTLMLTQYRLTQRALFKLITALCFEGSKIPRRLLRNGCQILMARHLEINSTSHAPEDKCITDCISEMIKADPQSISTAIINAVASIATDKADALQLACAALCQQMVICGVSNSEPAMRVFFDQITEPENINEVYANSAIILRVISSQRTPEEAAKIKRHVDRLLVPLSTKTEMPDEEDEMTNGKSSVEHNCEVEDIQKDLEDVMYKLRILESNRQTIEKAIQNVSEMMLGISEELDAANSTIRQLSHDVHNYHKILNKIGDDSSKHQLEVSTRKDLLAAQHEYQVEDHRRSELEGKLLQIQSAKTSYIEKHTALVSQIESLHKRESGLYDEMRQKYEAKQRIGDSTYMSSHFREPATSPPDKSAKLELQGPQGPQGRRARAQNADPSSLKPGVGATASARKLDLPTDEVGKLLIAHMFRVRQEAAEARLKQQPQNYEYKAGNDGVRVSSKTEITKYLLQCLLSTHVGLFYIISLPCGLKGVLNNILTIVEFDGTKRAIYELLFDVLGDKHLFKPHFTRRFAQPALSQLQQSSGTFPGSDMHCMQSTVGLVDLHLSHTPVGKNAFQHRHSSVMLRTAESKTNLFSAVSGKNKPGPVTAASGQPSQLHHFLNFNAESSQTSSVIEFQDFPAPSSHEHKYLGLRGSADIYMYNSSNYGALASLAMELSQNFSMSMSNSFSHSAVSELSLLEVLFIDELYLASLGCSKNYGNYTDFDVSKDHMMWVLITLARAGLVEVLCWELMAESSMSYGPALMLLTLFLSKCVQLLPKAYSNPIISLSGLISYYMSNLCRNSKTKAPLQSISKFVTDTTSIMSNAFLNFQHSISIYAELYEFVFTQGYFNQYVSQINLSQQQIDLQQYMQQKELERHGNNSLEDNLFERLQQLVEKRSKLKFSDILKTYITINDNSFAQHMLRERVLHINMELYRIRLDYLDQTIQKLFTELVSTKSNTRVGISAIECKVGFDLYYQRIDNFLKGSDLSDYPSYWNWNSITALIGLLCSQFGHAGETRKEVVSIWKKVTPIFENVISFMDGTIKQKHDSIAKLKRIKSKKQQDAEDPIATGVSIQANSYDAKNAHVYKLRSLGGMGLKTLLPNLLTPGSASFSNRILPQASTNTSTPQTQQNIMSPQVGLYAGNTIGINDAEFYQQCYDIRLMSLFEMPVTEYTLYMCHACINMISLLVRHSEGIEIIQKSKLPSVIYTILSSVHEESSLLSLSNYKANLSLSAISVIGAFSSSDLGLYLMGSPIVTAGGGNTIWTAVEQIIKKGMRPDLIQHIITSLNYSAAVTQTSLLPGIVELYTSSSEKADTMNHSLAESKAKDGSLNYVVDFKGKDNDRKPKRSGNDDVLTLQDMGPPDHCNILFLELNREARACLSEALKSTNVGVRYFATFHIAAMVRQRHAFLREYNVTCLCASCLSVFSHHFTDLRAHSIQLKTLNDVLWAAECLVTQCKDPITEIAICALIGLEELSSENNVLIIEYIVSLKPQFIAYGRIGEVLIERLASCNEGLQYLTEEKDILMPLLEYWINGLAPGLEWTLNLEERAYSSLDLGIAQNYSLPSFFREKIPFKTRSDAAMLTFYKADELMNDHLLMPHHTRLGRSSLYLPYSAADMPPAFREIFIANTGQIKEQDTKEVTASRTEKGIIATSFLVTETMTGILNKGMSNPCAFFSDYMNQYNGPDAFHRNRVSNLMPTYLRPCLLAELAKTVKGCEILLKRGVFKIIMEILLDPISNRFKLQYRAALWAIALIAQSEIGFKEIIARACLDESSDYIIQDSVKFSTDTFDVNDEEAVSVYTTHSVGSSFMTTGEPFIGANLPSLGGTSITTGQSQASAISGFQFPGLSIYDTTLMGTRIKNNVFIGHRGGAIQNIFDRNSSTSQLYDVSSRFSTSNDSTMPFGSTKSTLLILLHLLHNLAIFSDSYTVKQTATMCISQCCLNKHARRYFVNVLGWEIKGLSRSGKSYGCLPPVDLFETFYRAKPLTNDEVEKFILSPLRGARTSPNTRGTNESRTHNNITTRQNTIHEANHEDTLQNLTMVPSNHGTMASVMSSMNVRWKQSLQTTASSRLSLGMTEEKIEELKALLKYTTMATSPMPVELSEETAYNYTWYNLEHIYDWDFVMRNFKLEERYRTLGLIETPSEDESKSSKTPKHIFNEESAGSAKNELRILAENAATHIRSMRLRPTREYSINSQAYLPCGCKAGIVIQKSALHNLEAYSCTGTSILVGGLITNASLVEKFEKLCRRFISIFPKEVSFYILHDNDNEEIIDMFIQSVAAESEKIQRKNKKFARSNEVVPISALRGPDRVNTFESQILTYCNYLLSAYEPDVQQASMAIGILVDNSMPYRNSSIDYCGVDNVPRDSFFLVISQILASWPLLPVARRALLRVCDRPTLRTLKILDDLPTFAEDIDMTGLA